MSCIAIDLHTDCLTVAKRKDGDSSSSKTVKKYYIGNDSFTEFKETLNKDDYVGVEATINAFWFHDQLASLVKKVIVLDTNKINFKGNKTDNNDAKKLLDILEYFVYVKGQNEIPEVYVPRKEVQELRELFTTLKLQKKIKTQLKNRVYSLLKQKGHIISKSSLGSIRGRKLALELIDNNVTKIEIKSLLNQVEKVEEVITTIVELLACTGKKYFESEINILMTIPGFSFISAIALISDIDNVNRFKTVKKFCSYLRVAPRIKESNKTTHIGNINKSSRSLTLTLLTQSVIHFRNTSDYFGLFYDRLKKGKGFGKTRVALIRKILVCAYYMLKREETFKWSDKANMFRKDALFNEKAFKGDLNIKQIAS